MTSHYYQRHKVEDGEDEFESLQRVYKRMEEELKGAPYAVTNKENNKHVISASQGQKVWVIAAKKVANDVHYYVAYWFIGTDKGNPPPSLIPHGFKEMVTVKEDQPIEGERFERPVRITDPDTIALLSSKHIPPGKDNPLVQLGFNPLKTFAMNHLNALCLDHKDKMIPFKHIFPD